MTIKSMTGYGRAVEMIGNREITVEIRSVNNRYLDCTVKVPRLLGFAEDPIKRMVKESISRGKVDVFVSVNVTAGTDTRVTLNRPVLESYLAAMKTIAADYGVQDDISVTALTRFSDIFVVEKPAEDEEQDLQDILAVVDEALARVGMAEYALSSPHMLSGGQKQRVAIAGVVAMRPKIIVFDESTAMLDPVGRRDVFSLARKLNREEGITIVWITHFMEEAVQADRVAVMDAGRLVMQGAPREVFSHEAEIRAMGLDVPEMTQLAGILRGAGVNLPADIMTCDEMAVELCRLK